MPDSQFDDRIQALPPAAGDRSGGIPPSTYPQFVPLFGLLYGAFVGALMGALVALIWCCLGDRKDLLVQAMLIGGGIGSGAGALIGLVERSVRGPLVRPDIATIVGVVLGLALAVLAVFLGTAEASGEVFGNVFMVSLFGGPLVGMLIGAILDRGYEAFSQGNRLTGLKSFAMGIAVCLGIAWFMMITPWGADIDELTRRVKARILSEWRRDPDVGAVAIQKISLERTHGAFYSGVIDATFDGLPERYRVKVAVTGRTGIVEWAPDDE